MKKFNCKTKLKLTALLLCALMLTGIVGFGVYSVTNETVTATNSGSVQFIAGGFVDAKVEAYINDEKLGEIVFTAENMTAEDIARTLSIRNLKETDWLDNAATTANTADKYVEFKFVITNVKNASKDDYNLKITATDPTAPANATLTSTKPTADLAVTESTTYVYRYDVTGLKDVEFTAQSFVFNLLADKPVEAYQE